MSGGSPPKVPMHWCAGKEALNACRCNDVEFCEQGSARTKRVEAAIAKAKGES